jgi:L-threonylcarbamoyladenylate synthase
MKVERLALGGADRDLSQALVAAAEATLAAGGLLAIPTESSYGLAVDPRSQAGVELVYDVKGRSGEKALPVVAADAAQLGQLGIRRRHPLVRLGESFWPAALSVVVPVPEHLPASAGTGTLAVRVPDHAGLRALLAALDRPLTATSANPSGTPPVLDADALVAWLAAVPVAAPALVVDAGPLPGGPPSTLVALEPAAASSSAGVGDGEPPRLVVLRVGRVAPALVVERFAALAAAAVPDRPEPGRVALDVETEPSR